MPTTYGTVVYAGTGSSHSWTWLADLFENNGVLSVQFLEAEEFIDSLIGDSVKMAIISGGDGFSVAGALAGGGFHELEGWIGRGGTYVGICAGAYLPLPSSMEPFSGFNLSKTKIENIKCEPSKGSVEPRREVPYGNCSIVHPVRGSVEVCEVGGKTVVAPIYGGPVFKEPEEDTVLMRYLSFTKDTEFQADQEVAKKMILGKPAVIKSFHGDGSMMLFGPHLEHPRFPKANERLMAMLGFSRQDWPAPEAVHLSDHGKQEGLHRTISDLKVAVYGLENRSFVVGRKAWDGSRYMELISALEKRAWTLSEPEMKRVEAKLRNVREGLVRAKVGPDSEADEWTHQLVEATRECVDSHFRAMAEKSGACVDDLFGWPSREHPRR